MIYAYPCELASDGEGGATFTDMPGAVTGGPDRSRAIEMAEGASSCWAKPGNRGNRYWPN